MLGGETRRNKNEKPCTTCRAVFVRVVAAVGPVGKARAQVSSGGQKMSYVEDPSLAGGFDCYRRFRAVESRPPIKLRRGAVFFRFFGAVFVCPVSVCHYPAAEQRVRCKSS